METVIGVICTGLLTCILGDLKNLRIEQKSLREDVIWIQAKLDRRESKRD